MKHFWKKYLCNKQHKWDIISALLGVFAILLLANVPGIRAYFSAETSAVTHTYIMAKIEPDAAEAKLAMLDGEELAEGETEAETEEFTEETPAYSDDGVDGTEPSEAIQDTTDAADGAADEENVLDTQNATEAAGEDVFTDTEAAAQVTEAPQVEMPQVETPQAEELQTEAPQTEAPQTEAPQMEGETSGDVNVP